MDRFYKKSLLVAIAMALTAPLTVAQNANSVNQEISQPEINPFTGTSTLVDRKQTQLESLEIDIKIKEKELELLKKIAEKELMPMRAKVERLKLSSQIEENESKVRGPVDVPQITEEDIERRIQNAASAKVRAKEREIAQLRQQLQDREKQREQFSLSFVGNSDGGPIAVIRNIDNDFTIRKGSEVEGWEVVLINPDDQKVIMRKGDQKQTLDMENGIARVRSHTYDNTSSNGAGSPPMPKPNLPRANLPSNPRY